MGQPAGVGPGYSGSAAAHRDLLYRQIPFFPIPQAEALVERDGGQPFSANRRGRGCGNRKEGNFFLPGYDRGLSRSYGNGEYRRGGGGFGDRWTGRDFWMWVAALFGMMTIFGENVPGCRYRQKKQKGEWVGGPMYYLSKGLHSRFLAGLFSVACIFSSLGWAT